MDLEKAFNKIDNFCCSNHNTLQGNKVKYLNDREETINMFQDYQETNDDDFCKDVNEMVEALDTIKEVVDLQKQLGCSLEEIVEFMRLLKKTYYIDSVTGRLDERWSPYKSNEKELCKINNIFYKIKDKSE